MLAYFARVEPTCETRLQKPRSRLWSSPLQAVEMPHIVSHACPSLRKALMD